MKKSIIFLVSALLSVGTIQAAESITKCYGQDATMTASSGDSYQWYKDGVIINGATNQTYNATNLEKSATYTCEVTTNGTSTNTGNLITLGGFEFPAKKPTLREENKLGDWIDYQYLNFDDKGVNIGIGACTTAKNANDVKTAYFSDLKPHSGDYLLVCDGASDPDARVWSARNLKLKGGVEYQFSCWAANIDKEYALHGANSLPKLKFVIENETGKHTLLEFTASTTLGEWNEYKATYTPPKDLNWCHIYIVNYTTEPAGNDFALDDVYFGTVINSAGSTTTDTFNVTVYDTFNYKFATTPVCPGTQATITTTLEAVHGGTLEPASNYKYEWKENGKTQVVSTSKDLSVTAPNSVGTFSYVLSTSSDVCYTSGAKSQTISIDTRKTGCGTTATATKEYTPCSGTTCTLSPKSTFTTGTVTWKDASGTAFTDLNISITSLTPLVYTCIIETTAANGTPHTITETHTITPKDCGKEETINHPAVTYCTNQIVTLICDKTGSSVVWDHDPSLTNTEITVVSSNVVGDEDPYTCTITTKENGNTIVYIEKFSVKTKDCSITVESTMCNNAADSTLKASKAGTNYEYVWTMPNESTRTTKTDTIHIKPANANVGDVLKYSCKIYEIPYSNPDPNAPIAGRPPMLLGTDYFEITIKDCTEHTSKEEELQAKEDGSITLVVPEDKRCEGCTYNWYKRNEDGTQGAAVVKNAGEAAWQHTIYNATKDEYMCVITSNGNTHKEIFKIEVYTPKTSTYCFTADSEEEQKVTITTLTKADRDEYEWYWKKDNQEVPFPEGAISTEENTITLDTEYFANGNSNFPVKVHIVEKYAHKLNVQSTDTPIAPPAPAPDDEPITPNPNPAPIAPAPEEPSISPDPNEPSISPAPNDNPIAPAPDPMEPSISPAPSGRGININSSGLSKDKARQINDSTFVYSYTIIDETQDPKEVTVEDKFVVNPNNKYSDTFPAKTAGMSSHDGLVRLTDKGINGCTAYKANDPNNKYFIEVDGGDIEGPVFSIKQPGKIIKGEKYILRFVVRETSTIAGNPKTSDPAKIDFTINYKNKRYPITNVLKIDQQDWKEYKYTFIAKEDCDEVIITVTSYNTSSGYNDFAIDEITFTHIDVDSATYENAQRNATAFNNDQVVDEDGDGFVMWRDEHILYIYPHTTQTIIETAGPHKEYEKEVELPIGETITFRYDPSIYQEGMTQYTADDFRKDEYGCKHTVYFTLNLIELEPDLYFTPNDDGVHDKWMVKGIETAPSAYIMIYDRHSKLLYKSIGSEFEGWDGNYNGHGMVQDDYWYVILVPETEETMSGHFTLKR
ncbi:MAG: T9SS type B sorting domain-containing protein [Paludibacteraceae bacterium]|nr:T9SS type B sorting domain-containing protein [Paludibacteraceae bacterium]